MLNLKKITEEIISAIKKSDKILLVTHVNPDGDCIGSAAALSMLIENEYNVPTEVYVDKKVPEKYLFLKNTDKFKTGDELSGNYFDTVISVDCAAKNRITNAITFFDKAKRTINIDHHKTNPDYAEINHVEGASSSTGEILFNIAADAGWKITKDIANALYVAILTDTGGFKYENVSADTFLAVAELMKSGINPCLLYKSIYESKPLSMVKLYGLAVTKSEFLFNAQVGYTIITLDDMKKTKAINEYADGIVEIIRQVNSVDIAFLIKETEDNYSKVSLRSKVADVSKIAMKFGGGGHTHAAGCTIKKPYNIALEKVIEAIKEETGLC